MKDLQGQGTNYEMGVDMEIQGYVYDAQYSAFAHFVQELVQLDDGS